MKIAERTLNRLTKSLENVLENQDHFSEANTAFQESDQPALIGGLSLALPEDDFEKAIILFSRLNLLFQAGFLFERSTGDENFSLQAYFEEGLVKPADATRDLRMKFPDQRIDEIKTAPAADFLAKIGYKPKSDAGDLRGLLIRPTRDICFVLLSRRPDPWLKLHAEKVLKAILDGIAS